MIFAAGYLLWMFQRMFFGELSEFFQHHLADLRDLRPVEVMTLVPLGVLVVVFGLFPGLLLALVQGTVTDLMNGAAHASAIHLALWQ
jgi:NADH-quinone oxidoreductase subunit M